MSRARDQIARALVGLGDRFISPGLAAQARVFDELKFQIGSLHARQVRGQRFERISEAEFRVFSQFGQDGIIQYLIERVPIEEEIFVEIGVGDYSECNTRFLLEHDNWRGIAMDKMPDHLEFIKSSQIAWRHSLDAYQAYVTSANVNELISKAGISGDVGLLSIDIDGNDYWVLRELRVISPRIVVAEYNSTFGLDAITVPDTPQFDRLAAHHSGSYFGASITALHHLFKDAYSLVGSDSVGANAFFVRKDVADNLPDLKPDEAYVRSRLRDTRDEAGELTYLDHHAQATASIAHLPVVNVVTGDTTSVGDLLG